MLRTDTSRSPGGWRRRSTMVAALTMAALLLAAPLGSAGTPTTPGAPATAPSAGPGGADLPQEQVAAITGSAIVYIGIQWRGYVLYPSTSGTKVSELVTVDFSCSGFVASVTGYIVTAGHCADPVEGRKGLIEQFLSDAVHTGDITAAQAQELDATAVQNWKTEGNNNGSAIVLTVKVVQAGSASGVQVARPLTATVVENRPLDQGDVTLLKVEASTPMPALQVATGIPEVGSNIAAMGFPGSVSTVVDPSLEPSYKTGRVSANQTFNGSPFTQVDAAFSAGMSGGPVVNMQGQVIGVVSYGPAGETQAFNFAAGQETVAALLTRNGVTPGLSTADQAFRDGLTLFYAQQYREAAAKFDVVLASEPSHALAQKFKTKAVTAAAAEPAAPAAAASAAPAAAASGPAAAAPAPAAAVTPPAGTGPTMHPLTVAAPIAATAGTGIPVWAWPALALALLLAVGAALMFTKRRRPGRKVPPPNINPFTTSYVTAYDQAQSTFAATPTQCRRCSNPNPATDRFCGHCGAPATPVDHYQFPQVPIR